MAFSKREIICSIFSEDILDEFNVDDGEIKEFNFGEIIVDFLSELLSDIFNKVNF